jgi:hypothetical protein
MALGSRTNLRLAESVQAAAGSIRKAGRHSRSILVLGVRSDLLALLASRLGGGVKTNFSRNALTRPRLRPTPIPFQPTTEMLGGHAAGINNTEAPVKSSG